MTFKHLIFFGLAFLAALSLTPLVRALGIRFKVLDQPGGRKVHRDETPRLGGMAVLLAGTFPFLIFWAFDEGFTREIRNSWSPLLGLALGCLLVFGIGLWDDLRRLSPLPKVMVEIAAALLAYHFGLRIQLLTNPFGLQWDVSWLSLPLTVLWLVGITNALNLADGIDGLAAGVATFAAAILFIMTLPTIYTLVPFLSMALAGAALGFLRYNFSPATIFLGDSGSLFLGFYLACLSLWASEKSTFAFSLLIPVIVLGLPITDMVYAIIRRWNRGVPIGQADRDHIHHQLLERGYSQKRAVLSLYGFNLFLAILAGFLLFTRNSFAAYTMVGLGAVIILASRFLGHFKFSAVFRNLVRKWKESQKAKYLAFRTRLLSRYFEKEKNLEGRWHLVAELFEEIGIQEATFTSNSGSRAVLRWHLPGTQDSDRLVTFSLSVLDDKGPAGTLKMVWSTSQEIFPPGISRVLSFMANHLCRDLENPSL